jgi:hypothetical protein
LKRAKTFIEREFRLFSLCAFIFWPKADFSGIFPGYSFVQSRSPMSAEDGSIGAPKKIFAPRFLA